VTGSLKVTDGLTSAAAEPSLAGSVFVTDGAGSTGTPGVGAEVGHDVVAEAVPLDRRDEGVSPVRVAGLDGGLAAKGVVDGARGARPPRGAGVGSDLPEHVEDRAADASLAQDDGVVAVPVGDCGGDEVRHRKDRRVGVGVRRDEHVAPQPGSLTAGRTG
jgi:hypothetical protein